MLTALQRLREFIRMNAPSITVIELEIAKLKKDVPWREREAFIESAKEIVSDYAKNALCKKQ